MECEREILLGIRNSYWIANGEEEVTGWHSTLYLVYVPGGCLLGRLLALETRCSVDQVQ